MTTLSANLRLKYDDARPFSEHPNRTVVDEAVVSAAYDRLDTFVDLPVRLVDSDDFRVELGPLSLSLDEARALAEELTRLTGLVVEDGAA